MSDRHSHDGGICAPPDRAEGVGVCFETVQFFIPAVALHAVPDRRFRLVLHPEKRGVSAHSAGDRGTFRGDLRGEFHARIFSVVRRPSPGIQSVAGTEEHDVHAVAGHDFFQSAGGAGPDFLCFVAQSLECGADVSA